MTQENKAKSIIGAKKAIGQMNKVLTMLEADEYCMEIMQQIRAVEGLLKSLSSNVLEGHLKSCATKAFVGSNKKQHKTIIDELMFAFKAAKK